MSAAEIARNTPVERQAASEGENQIRARYQSGLASVAEVADAQRLLAQAEADEPSRASASGVRCLLSLRPAATQTVSRAGGQTLNRGEITMWLVLTAMRRPITILVAVIALALTSLMAIQQMKVDIFPKLGAPAIYVAQPYGGMDPSQMEGYLTYYYEYHFLYITGIEHVESKNIQGIALMKLVFHADTDMRQAMAEVVGYVNRARAFMPPVPCRPSSCASTPAACPWRSWSSRARRAPVPEMQDIALNRVRPIFATLPGVSAPPPFGGSQRTIVVRDRSGEAPRVPPVARRSGVRGQPRHDGASVRQRPNRRPHSDRLDERHARRQHPGAAGCAAAARDRPDRLSAGRRHDQRHHRHRRRLRARGRQAHGLHSRHEARRCLDSRRDQGVRQALPAMRNAAPEDVKIELVFDQSRYVVSALRGLIGEALVGAILTG